MPAKKPSVITPLHLLQQLSSSLVEHLQKACSEAQQDAEMLLAKLEKQRGRTQEKIIKARAKLDEAGNAGKSKLQTKARSRLAELDDMLAVLQTRQSETLSYLAELKRDAEQSMQLAQGITKVEQAAAQALSARAKPTASRAATAKKAPARSAKSSAPTHAATGKAASDKSPASATGSTTASRAQPAAAKSAVKTQASKSGASTAKPATAPKGSGGNASPAVSSAKPAAAKKPAPRKPAATKRPATTQSPSAAN